MLLTVGGVSDLGLTLRAADDTSRQGRLNPGAIVPGFVLRTPSGSRADVRARGTFSSGRWTVALTRALATSFRDEDRQFDGLAAGTTYRFGAAVLDNSGGGRSSMALQDPGVYTLGNEESGADVRARKVTAAPADDPDDPNWGPPFTTRGGQPASMAVRVTFRAAFDAGNLYILATWADATENDLKDHWLFDGDRWFRQPAAEFDEDRLAIMWDINVTDFATRGCWALCHNDTRMGSLVAGERADLWHWKAARTNPLGYADDQRLRDAQFSGIQMAGRSDDTGVGVDSRNADRSGKLPAFMGEGGPDGTTRFIVQLAEGVRPAVSFFRPAIYAHDDRTAIVVHASDYAPVSGAKPLQRGRVAFVYASGLGPVANQPRNGSPAPVSPLAPVLTDIGVTLAGTQCDVEYAGLAPGFAGVYQVNFRVPANAPSGLQDLVLTAGGVASEAAKAPVQ